MARETLSGRRATETFSFVHNQQSFTVSVGRHKDGKLFEVFLSSGKTGTDVQAIARDTMILISIALQYGTPEDVLRQAVTRDEQGQPASLVGATLDAIRDEVNG